MNADVKRLSYQSVTPWEVVVWEDVPGVTTGLGVRLHVFSMKPSYRIHPVLDGQTFADVEAAEQCLLDEGLIAPGWTE